MKVCFSEFCEDKAQLYCRIVSVLTRFTSQLKPAYNLYQSFLCRGGVKQVGEFYQDTNVQTEIDYYILLFNSNKSTVTLYSIPQV